MITSENIEKVAAALVAAQKEMGNAVKGSNNPFFKSKYADLVSIREAILPITSKHGLSVLQLPSEKEGKNYIQTVVLHESGQFMSSMDEVVVSKQSDPQAKLAAQTYTRRGSLQAFFNIGCEDDDGNTASGKSSSKSPSKPANKPANSKGTSATKPTSGGFGSGASKAPAKKDTPTKTPARAGSFGN